MTPPKKTGYVDLFEEMPLAIEIDVDGGAVGLVHADCPTRTWSEFIGRLGEQEIQNCAMWSRDRIAQEDESGVDGVCYVLLGR